MARPMTAIGNPTIANSPNFSAKTGDEGGIPPTTDELSALDKAMDDSGVADKPVEEVEREITNKALGKTVAKPEPVATTEKSETKPDEGRKIETPPEAKATTPAALPIPKAVTAPAVAPKAEAAPAGDQLPKDEEIDSIPEPKGLNPNNRENWKRITGVAKREKSARVELEKKYTEAVTTVNKMIKDREKLPEPIEKELNELRGFRKTFDYQEDAEFKEKFQKPIDDTAGEIYKILQANGVPEAEIKEIQRLGIDKIDPRVWEATCDALMDAKSQEDRKLSKSQVQAEREAAITLRKLVKQHEEKSLDKKQEIQKIGTNQSEWVKNRENSVKEETQKEINFVKTNLDKLQTDYPALQKLQAPENATEEQKKAVQEHNDHIDQVHQQFVISYKPANTDQRFDTAMKAAYALIADRELVKANALVSQQAEQIKSLTEELEGIKNNTRMTAPVGSGKEEAGKAKPKTAQDFIASGMKSDEEVEAAMQNAGL